MNNYLLAHEADMPYESFEIQENPSTFGQYTNSFTGEYEQTNYDFENNVAAFYAHFLEMQEPLGEEFEQVLCDNFYDLIVRT